MLEKAFRNGESVSSDYAKALDDAISKVHGVECNVHGTYTITLRQDNPGSGECVYLVAHATPRKHTVVVEYNKTGYTAMYSERDLTSQHDGVRVAAIAVGAQVRLPGGGGGGGGVGGGGGAAWPWLSWPQHRPRR